MKKRIMVLCLVFIMMFGVSGCMAKESKNINEMALDYMEEKYNEPFEYVAPTGNSISGTHKLLVSCKSVPDVVQVEIENYRKDDRVFRDNYIAVKYHQQTQDYLQKCASSIFEDVNVHYTLRRSALSESLPANASFEEYLSEGGVPLYALIEVRENGFVSQDQASELANAVAESGTLFSFTLIVVANDDYGHYSKEDLDEMFIKRTGIAQARINNTSGSIDVTWL